MLIEFFNIFFLNVFSYFCTRSSALKIAEFYYRNRRFRSRYPVFEAVNNRGSFFFESLVLTHPPLRGTNKNLEKLIDDLLKPRIETLKGDRESKSKFSIELQLFLNHTSGFKIIPFCLHLYVQQLQKF